MASALIAGQLKGMVFVPPASLEDAAVDREYRHSFCSPDPNQAGATCGGLRPATNPSGGKPPYSFTVGYRAGLLPAGLALNLNGILEGTPTVAGDYRFEVCAKDLAMNEDCEILDLEVNKPVTLDITFEGDGGGTFRYSATNPNDIMSSECPEGVGCTVLLKEGAEVTITAEAGENSLFAGWGPACVGTGDCVVLMDADKSVVVRLVPKTGQPAGTPTATPAASPTRAVVDTVALKVNVIGSGSGYVYSGDVLKCDGDCNLTDRFSDYTKYFQCLGSCTFTFERGESENIIGGSIKGTKTTFQEWGGDCTGDSGSCWLLMDADKEVTARFTKREVVIESYTCRFNGRYGAAYDYFVSASGTASGLVGDTMKEGVVGVGPNFEQFSCPSWTGVQQNVWPYMCARGSGDPERTSFTVSLTFRGSKGPPFTLSKGKDLIAMVSKGGYLVTGSDNTDIVCN